MPGSCVLGHCNGLLLLHNRLLNPAARWSAPLPELPPQHFISDMCLVFDLAASVSPQVFLISCLHFTCGTRTSSPRRQCNISGIGVATVTMFAQRLLDTDRVMDGEIVQS
jgi:hypothetical protein